MVERPGNEQQGEGDHAGHDDPGDRPPPPAWAPGSRRPAQRARRPAGRPAASSGRRSAARRPPSRGRRGATATGRGPHCRCGGSAGGAARRRRGRPPREVEPDEAGERGQAAQRGHPEPGRGEDEAGAVGHVPLPEAAEGGVQAGGCDDDHRGGHQDGDLPPAPGAVRGVHRWHGAEQPALAAEDRQSERRAGGHRPAHPAASGPDHRGGARAAGRSGRSSPRRRRPATCAIAPAISSTPAHQAAARPWRRWASRATMIPAPSQAQGDEDAQRTDVGGVGERERRGVGQRRQRGLAVEDVAVQRAAGAHDHPLDADGRFVGVEQPADERRPAQHEGQGEQPGAQPDLEPGHGGAHGRRRYRHRRAPPSRWCMSESVVRASRSRGLARPVDWLARGNACTSDSHRHVDRTCRRSTPAWPARAHPSGGRTVAAMDVRGGAVRLRQHAVRPRAAGRDHRRRRRPPRAGHHRRRGRRPGGAHRRRWRRARPRPSIVATSTPRCGRRAGSTCTRSTTTACRVSARRSTRRCTTRAQWLPFARHGRGAAAVCTSADVAVGVISNTGWDVRAAFVAHGLDGLVVAVHPVVRGRRGQARPGDLRHRLRPTRCRAGPAR